MKIGGMHVLGFILLVTLSVVLGNWAYKKLNLG
jgi:hypothetical protein